LKDIQLIKYKIDDGTYHNFGVLHKEVHHRMGRQKKSFKAASHQWLTIQATSQSININTQKQKSRNIEHYRRAQHPIHLRKILKDAERVDKDRQTNRGVDWEIRGGKSCQQNVVVGRTGKREESERGSKVSLSVEIYDH
jgi:hypothetical protein